MLRLLLNKHFQIKKKNRTKTKWTLQEDTRNGIQRPVRSVRPVQRIHPLPQHGRKHHAVYGPRVASDNDASMRNQDTVSLSARAKTQKAKSVARSGPKRMLFSTAASPATEIDTASTPEPLENFTASAREITAINNNRQITDLLCGKAEHGNTCDMLSIRKDVGIAEFCLREADFMQLATADIRQQLMDAASSSVTEVVITSIVRPGAYYKCKSTATRRLLHTETITITYVTRATTNYFVNLDILLDTGFSGLKRMTALDGTKLAICSSVSTSSKASVLVSIDEADQNRVCPSVSAQQHAANTTRPPDMVQTQSTFSISSLNVHVSLEQSKDSNAEVTGVSVRVETQSSSLSIPTYATALAVGGATCLLVMIFCCLRRHTYTKVCLRRHTYTKVTHENNDVIPHPFLYHGQDLVHPYALAANGHATDLHHW